MAPSPLSDNCTFQPEEMDLKITLDKQVVFPLHKEVVQLSIPWENLEEVGHTETGVILKVKKEQDPATVINPSKKGKKKLNQLISEGKNYLGLESTSTRQQNLAHWAQNSPQTLGLIQGKFILSPEKLTERICFYKDQNKGPAHREVYKRKTSLFPLFISLFSLGTAVLLTWQGQPTEAVNFLLSGVVLVGLLGILWFAAQSFWNEEIHLSSQGLRLVSHRVVDEIQKLRIQIASIPWDNLDSVIAVDKGALRGIGLCLRNRHDPETLLSSTLRDELRENYRLYRCDILIPVTDREQLLAQLKKLGRHLKNTDSEKV